MGKNQCRIISFCVCFLVIFCLVVSGCGTKQVVPAKQQSHQGEELKIYVAASLKKTNRYNN